MFLFVPRTVDFFHIFKFYLMTQSFQTNMADCEHCFSTSSPHPNFQITSAVKFDLLTAMKIIEEHFASDFLLNREVTGYFNYGGFLNLFFLSSANGRDFHGPPVNNNLKLKSICIQIQHNQFIMSILKKLRKNVSWACPSKPSLHVQIILSPSLLINIKIL